MYSNIKTEFDSVTYLLFNIIKIITNTVFIFLIQFNNLFKNYNFITNNYNLLKLF